MLIGGYIITFLMAIAICCALTPLVEKFAVKAKILAQPNPRKNA